MGPTENESSTQKSTRPPHSVTRQQPIDLHLAPILSWLLPPQTESERRFHGSHFPFLFPFLRDSTVRRGQITDDKLQPDPPDLTGAHVSSPVDVILPAVGLPPH